MANKRHNERQEYPEPELAAPVVKRKNLAADQRDGTIHDPVHWQGQVAEYVKDIGPPDPGYKADVQQSMIITSAGEQLLVPKASIMHETSQTMRSFGVNRVPGGPQEGPKPPR